MVWVTNMLTIAAISIFFPPTHLFFHICPSPNLPSQSSSRNCHPNLHLKYTSTCTLAYIRTWKERTHHFKSAQNYLFNHCSKVPSIMLTIYLFKLVNVWTVSLETPLKNLMFKMFFCCNSSLSSHLIASISQSGHAASMAWT